MLPSVSSLLIMVFITGCVIDLGIRMEGQKMGHCYGLILSVLCGLSSACGKQIHLTVNLYRYGEPQRKENQQSSSHLL